MKRIKAFILTAVALLMTATANDVFACSCLPVANPFLKVAPKSMLVIRGSILRHTGDGENKTEMDVEVLEILAGKTSKSVISVSGDPGNQCRPYVSWFHVGTEWILALEPAAKSAAQVEGYLLPGPDKGDYAISSCGAYWLEVKDGKVIGNVDIDDDERRHEKQEIPLEELRRRFAAAKKSGYSAPPASNNGMHPTRISVPLIENLPLAALCARRVMPGVMPSSLWYAGENLSGC